ncbi:MAG: helix-hairpin-helix domain-containing protein [Candidatus Yanofskybacteria bacterium]|nr:helix-hairpin-helix domain-containing protein [Candidatus Yanofskybacteria bacterium]
MSTKISIIIFSWLAAISGLFLFSKTPEQITDLPKTAGLITEISVSPIPTTTPTKTPGTTTTVAKTINPPASLTSVATPTATALNTTTSTNPTPTTNTTTFLTTTTQFFTSTPAPTTTSTVTPEQSARININTANSQELEKITGVGPVIAQRIVDYRKEKGAFQKIEDIKKVNGIGDIKFEKMKDEITI